MLGKGELRPHAASTWAMVPHEGLQEIIPLASCSKLVDIEMEGGGNQGTVGVGYAKHKIV